MKRAGRRVVRVWGGGRPYRRELKGWLNNSQGMSGGYTVVGNLKSFPHSLRAFCSEVKGEEFREDLRTPSPPQADVKKTKRVKLERLPKDVLEKLTERDTVKAGKSLATTLGVLGGAMVFPGLMGYHPLAFLASTLVIASRQHALFVLAHDAAHYTLFPQFWLNDLVGRFCGATTGVSMRTYRVVHRLHHNNLYTDYDPDLPLHGGYPRGKWYLIKKLLKDLSGLTAYKTYAYFFGTPAVNDQTNVAPRPLDDTSPRLKERAREDRLLVLATQVGLATTAVTFGFGFEYFALWVLPLVTTLQPMLRLRAIAEHGAASGDLRSPLTAARTNVGSKWMMWFMFPHHVNYHIEHHIYPSVPHYNLPIVHQEMKKRGLLKGAEVRTFPSETLPLIFADKKPN